MHTARKAQSNRRIGASPAPAVWEFRTEGGEATGARRVGKASEEMGLDLAHQGRLVLDGARARRKRGCSGSGRSLSTVWVLECPAQLFWAGESRGEGHVQNRVAFSKSRECEEEDE